MTTIPRLTTRGIRTAEHIRDRKPFTTSGALYGEAAAAPLYLQWASGQLSGVNLDRFRDDVPLIDYVVWSYSTPIAWHLSIGAWYIVDQSFSITTSKHQGNLYMIPRADHEVFLSPIDNRFTSRPITHRWRVECDTCGTVVSIHAYKKEAHAALHNHRINGVHPDGIRR